jgi:hypothetical protein
LQLLLLVHNLLQLPDVDPKNIEGLLLVERRVIEANVNPRLERLVQRADSVCREKQNTIVILENAKEH